MRIAAPYDDHELPSSKYRLGSDSITLNSRKDDKLFMDATGSCTHVLQQSMSSFCVL